MSIITNHEWSYFGTVLPPEVQKEYNDWMCGDYNEGRPNDTYATISLVKDEIDEDAPFYPNLVAHIKEELKAAGVQEEVKEVLHYVCW